MKTVVFMGTPDFAVPALNTLILSENYDVKLVVTQTDKPKGRKQILTPSPVKELALQHSIPIYQPNTLKCDEAFNILNDINPDFIVVSAYGKILPKNILNIPKYGCVNLHGSLLPKYRGAAPIQWSVINGDEITGVTTMLMDEGLDTGDIILTSEYKIGINDTAGEVFDALSNLCPDLLLTTLDGIVNNSVDYKKQNNSIASYVSVLNKEMSEIDWNFDAESVHNLIRGLNPWPVAKTHCNGKVLKIYKSKLCGKAKHSLHFGQVVIEKDCLFVACGNGELLQLEEIQLEGSKRMNVKDFLRGHSFEPGFIFNAEE